MNHNYKVKSKPNNSVITCEFTLDSTGQLSQSHSHVLVWEGKIKSCNVLIECNRVFKKTTSNILKEYNTWYVENSKAPRMINKIL